MDLQSQVVVPLSQKRHLRADAAGGHGLKNQFFDPSQQELIQLLAYWAQMPARCLTNKYEPIAFECPSCGAKYIIVTIEIPDGVRPSKFSCAKCYALSPVGEGRISFEYILLDGDPKRGRLE
jgi:hypothetical protein